MVGGVWGPAAPAGSGAPSAPSSGRTAAVLPAGAGGGAGGVGAALVLGTGTPVRPLGSGVPVQPDGGVPLEAIAGTGAASLPRQLARVSAGLCRKEPTVGGTWRSQGRRLGLRPDQQVVASRVVDHAVGGVACDVEIDFAAGLLNLDEARRNDPLLGRHLEQRAVTIPAESFNDRLNPRRDVRTTGLSPESSRSSDVSHGSDSPMPMSSICSIRGSTAWCGQHDSGMPSASRPPVNVVALVWRGE
jgi:hypothetical protein